jgi:hypothetical protein
MRSAGLSWSHDTCCALTEKLDRYPMRAYPNSSPAESEGIAPLFCTSAKLFRAGTPDGAVFISNRFLVQCPAEAGLLGARSRGGGGAARPDWPVDPRPLEHPRRDHLHRGRLPIPRRRVGRRSRTDLPRAIRRRFACGPQRVPLRSRGLSSPKVRHCHDRAWSLLALTILIGPDRSTTIRLPLASLPRTP